MPCQADKRKAFLLPHQIHTKVFVNATLSADVTKKSIVFATILGFLGMLRPHTFPQLKPSSFSLIMKRGNAKPTTKSPDIAKYFQKHDGSKLVGFVITFKSKTKPVARAYFPNLSSPKSYYSAMCPVKAMADVVRTELWKDNFMKSATKGRGVRKFLQQLTESKNPVPLYALRIGGRTWNRSQGLDRQFVDYLGTWTSPEASARYYREEPTAVLRKMRRFYDNLPDPRSI